MEAGAVRAIWSGRFYSERARVRAVRVRSAASGVGAETKVGVPVHASSRIWPPWPYTSLLRCVGSCAAWFRLLLGGLARNGGAARALKLQFGGHPVLGSS